MVQRSGYDEGLVCVVVNSYAIDDIVDVVRYHLEDRMTVDFSGVVKAVFNQPSVRVVDSSSKVRVYLVSADFDQPNTSKFEDRYYRLSVDVRCWSLAILQSVVDDVLDVLDQVKNDPNPGSEGKYDMLEILGVEDLTEADRHEHHNVVEIKVTEMNVYVGL